MNQKYLEGLIKMLNPKEVKQIGHDFMINCPFGWRHKRGRDRTPSFSIRIDDQAPSIYYCYGCKATGNLYRLAQTIWARKGVYQSKLVSYIWKHENQEQEDQITEMDYTMGRNKKEYGSIPVPLRVLDLLPKIVSGTVEYEWLTKERRISSEVIERFDLRSLGELKNYHGVVFPVFDLSGSKIVDLWVRTIHEKKFFRLKNTHTGTDVNYRAGYGAFYNQQSYDPIKKLIVVESALDLLRIVSLGWPYGIVATLGSPSKPQLHIEAPWIGIGFDNDKGGNDFAQSYASVSNAYRLNWGLVGIKDANELKTKEDFLTVFKNALPMRRR